MTSLGLPCARIISGFNAEKIVKIEQILTSWIRGRMKKGPVFS